MWTKEQKSEYNKKYRGKHTDYVTNYLRTPKGLVQKMYGAQILSCKNRKRAFPTYTLKELYNWIFCHHKFFKLYFNWINNGYQKDLIPSIDRISDDKSYTIDNIQLMTWRENNMKGNRTRDRHGSKNPCAKLNEEKIKEIRHLLTTNTMQKDIASLFGVAPQTISDIATKKKWKYVK